MVNMRKLTALCMCLIFMFGFTACNRNQSVSSSSASGDTVTDTAENSLPSTESTGQKTLIVYFSASGNTKKVANHIAAITGADLFELQPAVPYSDTDLDWTNRSSRVVREHDNPDERNVELVASTMDNWNAYNTVWIGYPIWWGIAAWPVDKFIESNDFTGKTVFPFCTSTSSGLGESGRLLAELAGTGNWMDGQRFSSNASEQDVRAWLESLGL